MKLVSTWKPAESAKIAPEFPNVQWVAVKEEEDVLREVADAEVVFGHIGRDAFLAARQLRWIQNGGAGVEKLMAIPELVESDVVITNTSGAHVDTIAESAFGMLVYLCRNFKRLLQAQSDHVYIAQSDYRGVGLAGMTMGIVGLGNIGRAIGLRARAFGMKVIAVNAGNTDAPDWVDRCERLDGLPDLMAEADVVVVCAPLTPLSRGMIGPAEIGRLKKGAYLIAVSRGGIIDEPALISSLESGSLAGAGLDVQAIEPLPAESPLWDAPNLILTPHCSDISDRTDAATSTIMQDNLRRYVAGEPLRNIVDKQVGY